jgi:hypothetical protein
VDVGETYGAYVTIQGSRSATEEEMARAVVYEAGRPPTDEERQAALSGGAP